MKSLFDVLGVQDLTKLDTAPEPAKEIRSAEEFCRAIVNSPQYRQSLADRILFRELHPSVECRILDHALGQPVKRVEVNDKSNPYEGMSAEQIEARIRLLADVAKTLRTNELTPEPVSPAPQQEDDGPGKPIVH